MTQQRRGKRHLVLHAVVNLTTREDLRNNQYAVLFFDSENYSEVPDPKTAGREVVHDRFRVSQRVCFQDFKLLLESFSCGLILLADVLRCLRANL